MNPDTIVAINSAIKSAGGLRKAAAHLKVSAGTLSDIVNSRHEHVSLRAENNVRAALGLSALHYHTVPACPDCGSIHTGRCKGRAVEVRPVRKPRLITRWADAPTKQLAAAIINRTEYP
jgi:hypothetical protein